MTTYQKIFNVKKAARLDYEQKGGFIRRLRLKFWQYRYDTLTVSKAVKTVNTLTVLSGYK
jgi:hypothetical protein